MALQWHNYNHKTFKFRGESLLSQCRGYEGIKHSVIAGADPGVERMASPFPIKHFFVDAQLHPTVS